MSDLLQSERAALEDFEAPMYISGKPVRPAVFPSVSQLDPERMARLSQLFLKWHEAIGKSLTEHIRTACEFRYPESAVVPTAQIPADGEESFWGTVEGFEEHRLLLCVPRQFAASICERIFGAPLEVSEDRELTAIEQRVLRDLAREWMILFGEASLGLFVRPADSELKPGSEGAVSWMLMRADMVCGPVSGWISVYMGAPTARILLGETPPSRLMQPTPEAIAYRLGSVPLEIEAVLGRSEFTIDDLVSLRVGDVIMLDRRSYDNVEVRIDDKPFFQARPGLSGQLVALDLVAPYTEERSL